MSHSVDTAAMKALVVAALAVWQPQPAHADNLTPPAVPDGLQVDAPNTLFLVGHAYGTQNYVCAPSGAGVAFALFTPQATLLDDDGEQIITHFFSPTPVDAVIRATWEDSRDTSMFFGAVVKASSDARFVAPGAIPWVLLGRADVQVGPTGGDRLAKTTFVQRVNTSGGVAPATGCTSTADLGHKAFVPYTADYLFYRGPDED